jgi:APA family basic amino acid/polyamine antiporter
MDSKTKLGLWSGVGIVMANMIGAGVLTTPGFMGLDLSAEYILLGWLVGGVIALCGARAYAAVARAIPRSGGEYRYLSTLWHPSLGYLAGWTSLLIGFSQPVAADAIAIAAFTDTLTPVNVKVLATIVLVLVTAMHAFDLRTSKAGQNVLVGVKLVLVVGFVVVGLVMGGNTLPTVKPEASMHGLPWGIFFANLIFIAFCYSGWNAAIYASEEFAEPRRDVPRAMLVGTLLVTGLYLLVNWVFVTNLEAGDFGAWVSGDKKRITLGHVLMEELVGGAGAKVMSVFMIVTLFSAMSAMTMIGPRVYAAMAKDGFLPRAFAGKEGKPPLGALLLQGGVALFCIWTQQFLDILGNVGAILTFMAALTALGVFKLQLSDAYANDRPGPGALAAAVVFVAAACWSLYFFVTSPFFNKTTLPGLGTVSSPLLWLGFTVLVTTTYLIVKRTRA